jgi:hypothetical protein
VGWQPPRMPHLDAGLVATNRKTNALSQEAGKVIGPSVFDAENVARHSKKHSGFDGNTESMSLSPTLSMLMLLHD